MQIDDFKYDFSMPYKENEREWLKRKKLNLSNVIAKLKPETIKTAVIASIKEITFER